MAAFETTRPNALGTGFGARTGAAVRRLVQGILAWNDLRKTRAALRQLSDHELEDIGLNRDDIDRISF